MDTETHEQVSAKATCTGAIKDTINGFAFVARKLKRKNILNHVIMYNVM